MHLNIRLFSAVLILLNVVTIILTQNNPVCPSSTKRAITNLKKTPTWLRIYFNFRFECKGKVTQYNFYAKRPGRFYVGAWRQHNATTWINVGINAVLATQQGVQTFDVPENEQFNVQSSDVIGIHYRRRNRGVLTQGPRRLAGSHIVTPSSRYHSSQVYAESITEQTHITINQARRTRTISLNPTVDIGQCNSSLINDPEFWIPNSAITASAYDYSEPEYCFPPHLRRWDDPADAAWCMFDYGTDNQWVQIAFNQTRTVTSIMLKGRQSPFILWNFYIIRNYTLDYRNNGDWITVEDASQQPRIFDGVHDDQELRIQEFPQPLIADVIKINPIPIRDNIGARIDIRGC